MQRRGVMLVVVGIVLAACSGGDDDAGSTTSSTDTAATTTTAMTAAPDAAVDTAIPVDGADEASDDATVASNDGAGEVDAGEEGLAPAGRPDGPDLPGLADASDEPIPDDPAVLTGVLDNGLTYYVRENDNPGAKADLRLAVRAGSVDESGDATGVAHFVEHMLFNGTELFPENDLIDVLRGFGAAFGADVNASTSFDETVYTLTVPNADESIETGLTVLQQWLSNATFDPAQVVAERGVVLDEWRVRTQSTDGRLFHVAEQMFLTGSPYGGRSPIGSDTSIESMTETDLVDFYDRWYRPDNAAVIVVGDVDAAEIVADLQRLFDDAAASTDEAAPAPDTTFALDVEPDYGLYADPDQQTVEVEVTLPLPATVGDGTLALRADLIDTMIYDALVRRLDRDVADGSAPFDRISRGGNSFVESLDAPALYAYTDVDRVDATLESLLDEYARTFRFGFTDHEVALARATVQSYFDNRFEGRESHQDGAYADTLVDAYLHDGAYPSLTDEYAVVNAVLDGVDAEAMATRFQARWANSAPHVIISTPAALEDQMPTGDEVLDAVADAYGSELSERNAQRDLPDALMARPEPHEPLSIEPVLSQGDELFDPVKVVYPNGVTLIVNTDNIVDGQVYYQAASPGGSSLVADEDVIDARYAADIVTASGLAEFNQAEVAQITAGTDTEVSAWITPYDDHFAGSAATADVEVLLAQLHLYMTAPRVDEVALRQLRNHVGPLVNDPASDAGASGDDALRALRYPGEIRYDPLPDPEQFATLDGEGVARVWNQRHRDASDWVFVFSGDVDRDEMIDLASAYLGTLPGTGAVEQPVDVEDPPPAGIGRADVRAGTGDTATVTVLFTSPVDDVDARLRVTADVATEVMRARLTDVIREELGETYSPSSVSYITTDPDPVIETYVYVSGSPDRVAPIADLVVAELDDLGTNGPDDREFSNGFAQVQEALNFVNNGQFVQELLDDAIEPDLELDDYLFEFPELDNVTADSVRRYFDAHVSPTDYLEVTVTPR